MGLVASGSPSCKVFPTTEQATGDLATAQRPGGAAAAGRGGLGTAQAPWVAGARRPCRGPGLRVGWAAPAKEGQPGSSRDKASRAGPLTAGRRPGSRGVLLGPGGALVAGGDPWGALLGNPVGGEQGLLGGRGQRPLLRPTKAACAWVTGVCPQQEGFLGRGRNPSRHVPPVCGRPSCVCHHPSSVCLSLLCVSVPPVCVCPSCVSPPLLVCVCPSLCVSVLPVCGRPSCVWPTLPCMSPHAFQTLTRWGTTPGPSRRSVSGPTSSASWGTCSCFSLSGRHRVTVLLEYGGWGEDRFFKGPQKVTQLLFWRRLRA